MVRCRKDRRRGFTLLEILIVVGILALLAAFVLPNVLQRGDQAKIDLVKSAIGRNGSIGSALMNYRADVGTYPEELQALYERPSDIDEDSGKWRGPYMQGTPEELKDPWGNEYVYKYPGEFHSDSYDLWSVGIDGQDGTDDDITNWTKK